MALIRIFSFVCLSILFLGNSAFAKIVDIYTNAANPIYQPLQLANSIPRANAVLKNAPQQITLSFSDRIQLQGSDIKIYNTMYGNPMPTSELSLINDHTIVVGVPDLPEGKYTVKWRVNCRCDIISTQPRQISGVFHFTVK